MSATRFIHFMLKLNDGSLALMFGEDEIASYLHNLSIILRECILPAHGPQQCRVLNGVVHLLWFTTCA